MMEDLKKVLFYHTQFAFDNEYTLIKHFFNIESDYIDLDMFHMSGSNCRVEFVYRNEYKSLLQREVRFIKTEEYIAWANKLKKERGDD